ncbi:MAG TPA: DUF898 domain-containing protein [Epsilonproteobacteria bacterium]|nr:DUF898 domain-containing protein [Campylobacterota bacterium]
MKALNFEGSGNEYFKIWIVNVLLVIVTLGLYYPWAKVRNHRYFYGNATLEGRNFEYHATGKQLFLGFLVAMTLFIVYVVIQQISPLGSLLLLLFLFVAIPWLIWRSLKFSMRMTSFSNVRFGFEGSLKESYINFFFYPFLLLLAVYGVPVAAAVAIPMMGAQANMPPWVASLIPIIILLSLIFAFYLFALIKKKNASYTINGSRYGQGVFSTQLQTRKFLNILLKTILLGLLVLAMLFLALGAVVYGTVGLETLMEIKNNIQDPQKTAEYMGTIMPIVVMVYLGLILAILFVTAYATARQREYIYENMALDDKITFASTLKAKPLAWVMITNFLMVIVTFGLAFPWAKVRVARLMLENTLVDTEAGFYEYVTQKQKEESSLGEQIGDAFDVDVGLGF